MKRSTSNSMEQEHEYINKIEKLLLDITDDISSNYSIHDEKEIILKSFSNYFKDIEKIFNNNDGLDKDFVNEIKKITDMVIYFLKNYNKMLYLIEYNQKYKECVKKIKERDNDDKKYDSLLKITDNEYINNYFNEIMKEIYNQIVEKEFNNENNYINEFKNTCEELMECCVTYSEKLINIYCQ